ncbi:peptide deformylase [Eubacterium sp. 1001713B170207_170306_E7]|uniref:peptide deformylase n=1 Tax=Eubacterium sp. 1001713B170207_170306_E7 TaxID=2787097 RepID=UPI00189C31ED|nr:peptide deformylase [Eubacterium sp. 1001713B170207_170306_E7]
MPKLTLHYNDDPVLRQKCQKVSVVDDSIRSLLDAMMNTLTLTPGAAALAANQAGILLQLIVIDYAGYRLKLINPEIIETEGMQECMESCLSFPGRHLRTLRPRAVKLQALNENGQAVHLDVSGEMAKCLCHEIDHLQGIVFTERVQSC